MEEEIHSIDKLVIDHTRWQRFIKFLVTLVLTFSMLSVALFFYLILPPKDFPTNQPVVIEKGMSAADVSELYKEKKLVKSSVIFYSILVLLHDPQNIKAGSYVFSQADNVFVVADKLDKTIPQAELVTVTLPEGYSTAEYKKLITPKLNDIDPEYFYEQAKGYEGYLFPDTYFVPKNYTADELIELLRESYKQKTAPYRREIEEHVLGEEGVVILASIIEREANTAESMRMVAGILLNRLNIDMPLQTDASMEYVLDKPLKELTPADLKIDSLYNTYLYRGLTPTPIGNPGLTAIRAVLDPTPSNYFFYISDNDGEFHYARTLNEHNRNINQYLR